MIDKIQKWLDNPKRDYHQGVEYFEKYASSSAKEKFLPYFKEINPDEKPEQFDSHFTILVNQVTFARLRLRTNPKAFVAAIGGSTSEQKSARVVNINTGNAGESPAAPDAPLRLEDLPKQFDPERERLKELVPLMASMHADLSRTDISDEDRAVLADELVKLDLERRSIWDRIDNYLREGEKAISPEDVDNEYSENDFVRGAQMAARVKRLKDNIRKNEAALEKHKESGKDHLVKRTEARLVAQKAELAELEPLLPNPEPSKDE